MSYIDSFHTPSKRRGPSAAAFMIAFAAAAGALFVPARSEACTRAVYLGPDGMIVTGRTMDWKEDPQSNIYLFPRGMHKKGGLGEHSVRWTSRYGSVVTAGYDIGTCDGMNERGLVANLLFLTESSYTRPNDDRPVMGLSIWTQYVLDNFATVDEAVAALSRDEFRIDAPDLPNGSRSTLHLSISDTTGNSAIFEYIEGKLIVHHGRQCQVMTNSPTYDKQITLNDYWEQIGGLVMLPGNEPGDRPFRPGLVLYQCRRADGRPAHGRSRRFQRNAQRFGPARHIPARKALYRLHPLEDRIGPEKPRLLFRIDPQPRYFLDRPERTRFFLRSSGQETVAHRRGNLRRECGRGVPGKRAFPISVRRLSDWKTVSLPDHARPAHSAIPTYPASLFRNKDQRMYRSDLRKSNHPPLAFR